MTAHLTPGRRIGLVGDGVPHPTLLRVGLGWQGVARTGLFGWQLPARRIALDGCALFYSRGYCLDIVYGRRRRSDDGSAEHGYGPLGGVFAGVDEWFALDLARVPAHIDQIVFMVNSFAGETFTDVQHAYCCVVDEATGVELARCTVEGGGPHTAQVMAKLVRAGRGWDVAAIGAAADGATFHDLLPQVGRHV